MPTFTAYKDGMKLESITGADPNKLMVSHIFTSPSPIPRGGGRRLTWDGMEWHGNGSMGTTCIVYADLVEPPG